MGLLAERYATLLAGLVEIYIETARPVGSAGLIAFLKLDVSSATVRTALHELEEAGYIVQPHTSAGRVPTDKGYRYYVDHLRAMRLTKPEQTALGKQFATLNREYQHLARSTVKLLSLLSHSVVVSGLPEARETQLAGLSGLLEQTEAESVEAVKEVGTIIDALDEYLNQFEDTSDGPQVFIGEEIPFMNARHTSLVVHDVHPENEQRMTVVLIGPKRMPYQRNVSLLNAVSEILENYEPNE
ncbi:hypothetical protein CL628_01260 [bacterium]|nr:hypothetical protein [bacterium]|tara:strand:- start:1332 stop:2057 length:726 start_codon:yes stop_codon:yes gene_type:complete